MRSLIHEVAGGATLYYPRHEQFQTDATVPFRVSPEPLGVTRDEMADIQAIGEAVVGFMSATADLYQEDETVHELLDRAQPEGMKDADEPHYLFVRPDLIAVKGGFAVCEIETSPFGLALSDILNRSYRQAGFDTLVDDDALAGHLQSRLPEGGEVLYSAKTAAYRGQLDYLASLMSAEDGQWVAGRIAAEDGGRDTPIYRAFYAKEYDYDSDVRRVVDTMVARSVTPGLTPQYEEKAIMGLLWDARWDSRYGKELGAAALDMLRDVIPPTLIIGEEQHFLPGLPNGVPDVSAISTLSRAKRQMVLKPSSSSWAEGVHFLHKKSQRDVAELLNTATADFGGLHVLQEFRPAVKLPMTYEEAGEVVPMSARVRITPYFAMEGEAAGELLSIKATGCEGTDYIHASTASINTAVSVE